MRPIQHNELKSPKFMLINPSSSVPVLIHRNSILSESLAIIEFLEEEYPITRRLLPGDSFNKAVARSLALNIVSGIQPLQNQRVLLHLESKHVPSNEWAQHYIYKGFTALEKRLQQTSGRYCVGDEQVQFETSQLSKDLQNKQLFEANPRLQTVSSQLSTRYAARTTSK